MNPRFSWKQKAILVYIQIAALTWERVMTLHWDKENKALMKTFEKKSTTKYGIHNIFIQNLLSVLYLRQSILASYRINVYSQ